ncbi:unnamed protein product [Somion occarium]|uniref:Uncharacterized protein n=1 Tax=Somion occarium TaxID=3059160 RepID=A0ABP1D9M7_9APHY
MTTFTPPTPRRTVPRRSTPGATPPPPRRRRMPSSKQPSRFATPVRAPSFREDSVLSGMDVDEESELYEHATKSEIIFSKSDEMQVTFYAHLPAEVKQILHNANFYRDAYTGDIDTLTGFALVASAETCFVWNYSQALAGTPTCYIFGCPQEGISMTMSTPFHALVPYGPSREPGLILMNSAGQIRFWESLASGLAGGEHWTASTLDLYDEESVTTLTRADPQTFIASTSLGRLFRLTLTSSGGKYHLSPRSFSRLQSSLSLSRFFPTFFSSSVSGDLPYETGNISAVALREHTTEIPSGRDVWALIDFRIQRWTMSAEGWEELELDEDIASLVRPAIRAKFDTAPKDDAELDLELLDLKLLSANEILLLVSYAGQEDLSTSNMEISSLPRRIYALLQISSAGGSFEVDGIRSVPYQSTSSSGAPMHPRMQLILHGRLITIQFGDTVTICARENEYMDRLELKSASDRTLGVGIVEGESEFLVLTAATLMKAYIDVDAVAQFDPEFGRANLIKSTMTQAILYGSHVDNPLHFSFPPEVDGEALIAGAEQLSQAILESDHKVVRPNPDLSAQITHRIERLEFLIKFINDNAVLTKMSQRCRQRLETDVEKMNAAQNLWLKYNQYLSSGHARNVLSEAVYHYMTEVGEGHHEDLMRAFFRLKVDGLGDILPKVLSVVRESAHDLTRSLLDAVPQANEVVLTILDTAKSIRQYNFGQYGLVEPLINPWTSQLAIIDIVSELFNLTTKLVERPASEAEPSMSRLQIRKQLPQLASVLFACYHERLQWVRSPMASSEVGFERERSVLEERFRYARSEILETLRRDGFSSEAFQLAEVYRDFRSLASLCNKEKIYPPQENPNAQRIHLYIDKFKEAFTTELFQWYIEHGELRTMFAQEQNEYLDRFFAEHPYPNISWIHHLGKGRYDIATEALLDQADHATELSSKHLMLSIGKLSYLALLHEDVPPTLNENVLNAFHDGLDFVSVHETMIDNLRSALDTVRTKQSLEQQVDTIAKSQASSLSERRALYSLVRRLLQGKALSVEDAADVLSMKDNDDRLDDYITALHLLATAKQMLPARRLSALRSVWRRIYLHDDWDRIRQTANVPDEEVNERFRSTALYAAMQATTYGLSTNALEPDATLVIPSFEEISTRWPGIPAEEVAAIQKDYEADVQEVAALNLGDAFIRVKDLVAQDQNV